MSPSIDTVAAGSAAALVGLDQRPTHNLLEWGQATHELVAALAQGCGRNILHVWRTESTRCPIDSEDGSSVNPSLFAFERSDEFGECKQTENIDEQWFAADQAA